jgi:transglutaminase-like putative cysteine protease
MIYRVRHLTRYDYQTPVDLGAHLAHLRPRPLPHQRVLRASLQADPPVSWRREGVDHFGNEVSWLFHDVAHGTFEVTAEALVDVSFPKPPDPADTLPWETVVQRAWSGGPEAWQAAEYLFDSRLAPANAESKAYATASFPAGRPIFEAVWDLNTRIRRDFTFRSGVTTTSTPIQEVLRKRQGVCQDFTHLMISALRGLGLPARYVSGYIRTHPPRGQPRRLGAEQSHAWVGAWLGPEHGWVDFDPTNGIIAQEEHVVLGWGRDFGDITPLRGVILGGGEQSLLVEVHLDAEAELAQPTLTSE